MRVGMKQVIVFLVVLLLGAVQAVQAADLRVYVSCIANNDGGRPTVWFGYYASNALSGGGFGYKGDGPGIYADSVEAGDHPRTAEAYFDKPIMFFVDGFFNGEYLYAEAWFDATMTAPDCDESGGEQPVTLDDQGAVNNPLVNDRANTCYDPGQVCASEAEWEAGWYLIREQYGLP